MSTKPGSPNWDEVIKILGPSVTAEACKQQYKAIKKITGKDLTLGSSAGQCTPNATLNASPRKRKQKGLLETEDDSEGTSSPSKRNRKDTRTKSAEPKIKPEPEDGLDGTFDDVA